MKSTVTAFLLIAAVLTGVGLAAGPQMPAFLLAGGLIVWLGVQFVAQPARRGRAADAFARAVEGLKAEIDKGALKRLAAVARDFDAPTIEKSLEPLRDLLLIDHPDVRQTAKTIVETWAHQGAGRALYPLSGMVVKLGGARLKDICPHRAVYTDLGGAGISYELFAVCPPGSEETYDDAVERLERGEHDVARMVAAGRSAPPDYHVESLARHDPAAARPTAPLKREEFVALIKGDSADLDAVLEWLPLVRPPKQARYESFAPAFQKWADGVFQLDLFAKRLAWPPRAGSPVYAWDWYVFEGRILPAYVELRAAIDQWPDGPLRARSLNRPEAGAGVVEWDQEFVPALSPRWSVDKDGSLLPVAVEWHAGGEPSRRVIV